MNFTTSEFKNFRNDVQKALEEVSKKYEVSIELGNIQYSANAFTFKATCTKTDVDVEIDEFKKMCKYYGFTEDHFRKPFVFEDGMGYMLVGFNVNSPKYECKIERVKDHKVYKATTESVKKALNIA